MIDRVTASRLGIAPATIDNTLYDAFGQRQISTMYTQLNQYHVILEAQPQFQQGSEQARAISTSSQTLPPEPAAQARRLRSAASASRLRPARTRPRPVRSLHALRKYARPPTQCYPNSEQQPHRTPPDFIERRQCRSPQRLHAITRPYDGTALHHPPGAVSCRHHLVQSGAQRLAGQRHHRHRQGRRRT